ncbi:MAG TPA: late competence development ComFB family protein [Gemmatimonadaceae bacterium]|nr:late competence development ComFB family protein [Gemmatimonadaceae bacterium]
MQNVLEEVIASLVDELRAGRGDVCACSRCRDDMISLALNHVRPRYVSGAPAVGAAVTRVDLARDQARAQLLVVVLDAIKRVANNPRHPLVPPGTPGGTAG